MRATLSGPAALGPLTRDEVESLRRHAETCRVARGRWFGALCAAERLHRSVAPRFFTTVVGAAALLAACALW